MQWSAQQIVPNLFTDDFQWVTNARNPKVNNYNHILALWIEIQMFRIDTTKEFGDIFSITCTLFHPKESFKQKFYFQHKRLQRRSNIKDSGTILLEFNFWVCVFVQTKWSGIKWHQIWINYQGKPFTKLDQLERMQTRVTKLIETAAFKKNCIYNWQNTRSRITLRSDLKKAVSKRL